MAKKFPHYRQVDEMDCGATCLRIIFKYYGKNIPIQKIRRLCQTTNTGVTLLGLSRAAESLGLRSSGIKTSIEHIKRIDLPCILHWNQNHFVVLYRIKGDKYYISDPALGLPIVTVREMKEKWLGSQTEKLGALLLLSPTSDFHQFAENDNKKLQWSKIFRYFSKYRSLITQLILGLLLGTVILLVTPFLTQSVVDVGIHTKNLKFINLILIAQLMLFIGQISVAFLRSWILLHITTRVNISILTDLLIKLMRLPVQFFDLKTHGDIMQRLVDQQRLESFLTGTTLNTIFSLVNILIFGVVLAIYHKIIFIVFLISTILYVLWIWIFMNPRRILDEQRFQIAAENQTYTVEMIQSIRDIKLNNAEKQKRWKWEALQARLFNFKVRSLTLSQYQTIGSMAINQAKGILITYISAKAVIDGEITLGSMMAIQYIVGMASQPVESILGFMGAYQDAKISLERLDEIYNAEEEEAINKEYLNELPKSKTIEIKDLTFGYFGAVGKPLFRNLNLVFPESKTTAIVGASGSGKTTILKLLLRFYNNEAGEILIGGKKLDRINFFTWRDRCGSVMQENYLYADTIENNIAVGEDYPDRSRIEQAIEIANLTDFIDEQPFGLDTKIGTAGKGVSQGQRQRLMIARAVYKNPDYLFLDEATNALDSENESQIMDKLNTFYTGRTVIIVAHRLSTVKNADNIIVLNNGEIVEQGNHEELTALRGFYFNLVKNQLELGG